MFRDRKAIVPIAIGGRTVEAPGSPLHLTRDAGRISAAPCRQPGEHNGAIAPRAGAPASPRGEDRRGPLEGLRIIDLSMGWAGPICTRNLADLGADVIKIEACGYPDWWRGVDNRIETVTQRLYEKSPRFNIMNRGKRAITLDLTVPEGVALAKALVKDADAVIENYSAEVLRKFGLDYPELAKVNPSLVMVSMAAFGGSGPWRETRAYGSTLEQGSGLPSVGGRPDDPPMMNHLAYRRRGRRPQCLLGHADRVAASQADRRGPVHRPLPGPVHAAFHRRMGDRAVGHRPGDAARRQSSSAVRAARRLPVGRHRQMGVRSPRPTTRCGRRSRASSARRPGLAWRRRRTQEDASSARSPPGRASARPTRRWRSCSGGRRWPARCATRSS